MQQSLVVTGGGALSPEVFVAESRREAAPPECTGDAAVPLQRQLPGILPVRLGPFGMVEEHTSAEGHLEIRAAQILKVVADAQVEVRVAEIDRRAGHEERFGIRRDERPVAVVHAVVVGKLPLENMPAEVFARDDTGAVRHAHGVVFDTEHVADVGIAPLVIDIPHKIARRRVLRRGVEVQHRVERIARAGFQVERQRTVELPVGHRGGPDRPRGERRAQRQRGDRVVDLGTQTRRIGHVGFDGQLRRALDARHVGLGHFDLFLHLSRGQTRQRRQHEGGKYHSFHRQFSFAIRAFASSTMPSSAGV